MNAWLKGLLSAVIGAAAGAVISVIVSPETFSFTAAGSQKSGPVMLATGTLALAMYWKRSSLPASSRASNASKPVMAFLAVSLIASLLTGCVAQQTIAALTQELGTASQSIATLEGNTALAAQLQADTTAAVAAIDGWKQGTPAQDVIQALNIVENDLNLIPAASPYAPLIDIAIGTVEGILALLPAPAPSTATAAVAHASVEHRQVTLAQAAPKNAKQFKTQWNGVVATHPGLAAAALK